MAAARRAGRFEIKRVVGKGAVGCVYDASDSSSGARVALKVANAGADALLLREAELSARLRLRWGPRALGAGTLDIAIDGESHSRAYLALEWVDGVPLSKIIADPGTSHRITLALHVGHAVASALAELVEADAVHGDVKPDNVLVRDDHAKSTKAPKTTAADDRIATLVDLSLAAHAAESSPGRSPRYAPADVRALASPERDVFALGVMLAEIVSEKVARSDHPSKTARTLDHDSPFFRLIHAMLAEAPGARPPAHFVAREIARLASLRESPDDVVHARRASIARTYLAAHKLDLTNARPSDSLQGPPREWIEEAITRSARDGVHATHEIGALHELARRRWLTAIVGPYAAGFDTSHIDEAELATNMLALATELAPEAWTESDLRGTRSPKVTITAKTPLEIAVALSAPRVSSDVIEKASALAAEKDSPAPLVFALAARLLKSAEPARASLVIGAREEPRLLSLRAECARRSGDRDAAVAFAEKVLASPWIESDAVARAHFVLARLEWDFFRDDAAALARIIHMSPADAVEIESLVEYGRGQIDRGLSLVSHALSRDGADARLYGLSGLFQHAKGEADAALLDFGRAVEIATAANALEDEATYRTGEAAAAIDAGDLARGLASSTRALLLCDRIGKRALAARAWLQRGAAFAIMGAPFEAISAASESRERARAAGDGRCELYADLLEIDAREHSPERDALATSALERARAFGDDDTIRAIARAKTFTAELLTEADRIEARAGTTARIEYWGARAGHALESLQDARIILGALLRLTNARAPCAVRATAFDRGRELATRAGDGEAARRFEEICSSVRARIEPHVPDAYKARFSGLSWVARRRDDHAVTLSSPKLGELFAITRALSARESLRELCEMTLDAMVLWSGVERGLLLLPAPGGVLKVRAARNIRRQDLKDGETRRLSMSMADRAFTTRETVVADDAWATMSDVHASVHALGLRSVLAVPLVVHGAAVGVVYLDDRHTRGAFGRDELAWVELVAGLAAMAIRDVRDQLLLRRAQRHAERATKKIALLLSERDKELSVATELLSKIEAPQIPGIVGESQVMKDVSTLLSRVGKSDVPVLVLGESGTGKELVARAIASHGTRKNKPFLSENCASLPEQLLESTLFGHVKGSFTGAVSNRVGLFDVADSGTLLLDEVGEMSPGLQAKLLRVLQDGEVRPVGGTKSHRVDVRIISATHRDLEKMVAAGTFREDLYYRLNVVSVRVPSLRDRREDIPLLVAHFIAKYAGEKRPTISPVAMKRLLSYAWPGNVRQLENEIRRAVVLSERVIDEAALSEDIVREKQVTGSGTLRARIDELEVSAVKDALKKTRGNQTRAATMLGLSRFGLQKMMKRLNVEAEKE